MDIGRTTKVTLALWGGIAGALGAFAHAADRLHAVTATGDLLLVEGIGGGPIASTEHALGAAAEDLAISPSGRIVAAAIGAGGPVLLEVDGASGATTPIGPTPVPVTALVFDGAQRLFGLGADSIVRRYDPASGQVVAQVQLDAEVPAEGLAPGPDGTLLAVCGGALLSLDPETGAVDTVGPLGLPGFAVAVRGLAVAPSGDLLAVADGLFAPSLLFAIDRESGGATFLAPIEGTAGESVRGIAFDPPGTVGVPGAGLGAHHDLVVSWVPSGGGGVLIGAGAGAFAPGMLVVGLEAAVVEASGFSFLVDPSSAVLVPVALAADGTVAIPVPAAALGAVAVVHLQLLAAAPDGVHASHRVELHGGESVATS